MTLPTDLRAIEASGGGAWRWVLAAGVVAATYGALVWLAVAMPPPEGALGETNEAVMIELEPVTAEIEAPPPAPEPAVEPAPEIAEAPAKPIVTPPAPPEPAPDPVAEEPPPEVTPPADPTPPHSEPPAVTPPPVEPPPEPEPVEPQSAPEPVPPIEEPKPAVAPEHVVPEEKVPDLPVMETRSDAVLNAPIPMARPTPPRPQPTARKQERTPPPKTVAPKRPANRAAPQRATTAERSDSPPARNAAAAPRVSPASWQRQAVSHFRKFRRKIATSTRGVAKVAVTIDRGGTVLSARLAGSSGNRDFDAEAIALVRRASPIPAPPAGVGGRTLSLIVPVDM